MNAKLVLTIFVIGLAVAQIIIIAGLSGRGQDLAALQDEERQLVADNQRLRNEIGEIVSFSKVASASAELGFAKPGELLYLSPEAPVAQKPNP